MKRFIKIEGSIEEFSYGSTAWSLNVDVSPEDVKIIYTGLQKILFEEASSLTVQLSQKGKEVKFQKAGDKRTKIECLKNKYIIHLEIYNLELIVSYLFGYLNEEPQFIGHLDIEMEHTGTLGPDATMVFAISNKP